MHSVAGGLEPRTFGFLSRRPSPALALIVAGTMTAVIGGASAAPGGGHAAAPQAGRDATAQPARPAGAPSLPALARDVELTVAFGQGDDLRALLERAGVDREDAAAASAAATGAPPLQSGQELRLFLAAGAKGGMRLAGLEWQPRLGSACQLARTANGGFALATAASEVDATPRRFTGQAGAGLFWALRKAGVPAGPAREYLAAIQGRTGTAQVGHADRFDLIVERRAAANGAVEWGQLLYAGLDRQAGADVRLVRWSVDGQEQWAEPGKAVQRREGMAAPVTGRLSSGFGYRFHPVLGVGRFHRGIDLAAPAGTPVTAADDGWVSAAGWNGGYGRQVTLRHSDGLTTSYGHLSALAAREGLQVRRGEVIGYVGSSGLSTGPHLHFEAMDRGRAVDPLSLRRSSETVLAQSDAAALGARLRQLLSI